MELVNDSEFVFELGSKVLSWLLQLELVNSTVKVLSKTDKFNILVPGDKIKELFSNVKKPTPVLNLPQIIPRILKPKMYMCDIKESKYSQLGGYLLNDEMYTNEIILLNWELSSKSTLLSDNIVC